MKRWLVAIGMAAMLLAFGAAAADPMLTDGKTQAWIGENSYLYLTTESGATRRLSVPVRDLLGMSETELYCLMDGNSVYAIKRDGSGSSLLYRSATAEQINALKDARITLQEGDLKAGESLLSSIALDAVTDGGYVYYIVRSGSGYRLMQSPLPTGMEQIAEMKTANLNGIRVIEPGCMTVGRDAIVITAPDHSVMTVSLETGETRQLQAGTYQSVSAAWTDGKLYRYLSADDETWSLEAVETMTDIGQNNEISPLQPVSTATATPTPKPTAAVPTATPAASGSTSRDSSETDDGELHRGDRGTEVRRAQRRLYNLGYPVGNVDGAYGEDTQYAVHLFYAALGEKELDYMSEKMLEKLYSSRAPEYDPYMPLRKGNSGTMVRRMQQRLTDLGYSTTKLDGIYGKLTAEAVAWYQMANGIEPDTAANPGERASRDMLISLYGGDALRFADWQAQGKPIPPAKHRGWLQCGSTWLYYDGNGVRTTGWSQIGGKWFYFNELGFMLTKWQAVNGNWYYLDEKEGMLKGWFEDKEAEKKNGGEIWYWLDENGVMATDWVQIDGTWYYFNQSGIWQPGGDGK